MADGVAANHGTAAPAFTTPSVTVYCGDTLAVLREMPDESVDCVVTSPPYWGLRAYRTARAAVDVKR